MLNAARLQLQHMHVYMATVRHSQVKRIQNYVAQAGHPLLLDSQCENAVAHCSVKAVQQEIEHVGFTCTILLWLSGRTAC